MIISNPSRLGLLSCGMSALFLNACAGTKPGDAINRAETRFDHALERQTVVNKARDQRYDRWWDKTMDVER